ncbi:MAG TPA: HAMP domain-containing sensor histidine kinase [Gemmatimonadota bacterium]|nr:HAMP domain-containing sensor histidine kinase [Gemmatimonadota bacterium]
MAPVARSLMEELAPAVLEDIPGSPDVDLDRLELLLDKHGLRTLWAAIDGIHVALDLRRDLEPDELEVCRSRLARLAFDVARLARDGEIRAQKALLRDISHDIRSPLNSILFLSEGLYSHNSANLTSAQRRQLGIVYAAAASLLNLVNDLLDFARTTEGNVGGIADMPFGVASVLSDVQRLVSPLADHHNTSLTVESHVDGARRGDPQVLCRLLINLVSNAIEAAGERGSVEWLLEDAEDGSLRVTVADDGPGADLDSVRELLAPQQEGRITRMLRGRTRGLGLVICGRLVRAAGGSIDVAASEAGGTRFTLELPFPKV